MELAEGLSPQWLARRRRADTRMWIGNVVVWCGLAGLGLWAGRALGDALIGVLVGAAISGCCLLYATYLLTSHVMRRIGTGPANSAQAQARIRRLLDPLCQRAGMDMPVTYVVPTQAANAFACGVLRRNRYIGVTAGAIELLDDRELSAVLGHEVTHLARRDSLTQGWWIALCSVFIGVAVACTAMAIGSSLSARMNKQNSGSTGAIVVALALFFAVVGWFLSQCFRHSVMRRHEYAADEGAVLLTGDVQGMISCLQKLATSAPMLSRPTAVAAVFSVNPVDPRARFAGLFATHPPIRRRIAHLQTLAILMGD